MRTPHFPLIPLKHLCREPVAYGRNESSDSYVSEGVRFLRTTDITDNGLLIPSEKGVYLPPELAASSRLLDGDLLLSRSGTIGRAFLYRRALHGDCAHAGYLVRFRPKPTTDPRWLFYFSKSTLFRDQIAEDVVQSTIANFNGQKFASLRVPSPPLSLQRRIADFLDIKTPAIDDLIAKKERLAHLLQEKRQAVITQAVTKGLDPNVKMKESGIDAIGSIPSHWQLSQLMHLTAPTRPIMYGIVLPGPHVADGIPIVKSGDCRPERLRLDLLNRTTPEIEAPYARARLEPGDIVYAIRGSIGMAALVPKELRGANLTQDAARIAPRKGVNNQWLLFAVQSDAAWAQLEPGIVGATVKGINIRDLKRPWIPVPPPNEQHAIALELRTRIGTLTRTESATKTSIAKLREYRQTLITAAVTGKLDVTTHERTIDDTLTALEASG